MKHFFHVFFTKIKTIHTSNVNKRKQWPLHKAFAKLAASEKTQKFSAFLDKHALLFHVPLSLFMCFVLEWMSRHSFMDALSFVTNHTGAYLYNSYLIFVAYTLVFLISKQSFMRYLVSAIFVMLGITNCIVLFNRVTPFGFSDLNMISDLLTMQNTNYFSAGQAAICTIAIVLYAIFMIRKYMTCKSIPVKVPFWIRLLLIVLSFASVPVTTNYLQEKDVLSSYFGNLAQGYLDYGYVYGFSTSMLDRGMSKPDHYSKDTIDTLVNNDAKTEPTTLNAKNGPNVVVVLLESFYDVSEADFVHTSEDPIPYFHELEDNYSTGHLTVPVVGAGTCNTEFEMLTGMSCQFFGPGEYPQKTVLKKTDCESVAGDLKKVGYSSHVVHNNGGNFYSRANAFSQMCFDTFTCKEMLDITDYTPLGSWPTDNILVGATKDAMDSTPDSDFVYTITVGSHGDYPTEKIIENPAIQVTCDGKDQATTNKWEYYINMLHNVDEFMREYTAMFDKRGEDTLVIFFGDHLPTMGLTEDEIATGDLFQTKYVTWNNFGMSKKDADYTSYQLVSEYLDRLNFHEGTMVGLNQKMTDKGIKAGSDEYMNNLELMQYDLLYGDRYAYGGKDLFPASKIEMGIKDVVIRSAYLFNGRIHIYGDNFSKWSKVYVNGEKVNTTYESGQCLTINSSAVQNGDTLVVNQLGSNNTIFRSSNKFSFYDPNYNSAKSVSTEGENTAPTNEKND